MSWRKRRRAAEQIASTRRVSIPGAFLAFLVGPRDWFGERGNESE